MITYRSYEMIKRSVTKTVTIFIVNQIIQKYLLKIDLNIFDSVWFKSVLATMAGFMTHDIFTYKLRDRVIEKIKPKDDRHIAVINDLFYFGTMLLTKEIILSNVNQREINVKNLRNIGLTLCGFVIYDLLFLEKSKSIYNQLSEDPKTLNYGFTSTVSTFTDTAKTILAILVSDFIPDYAIELSTLPTVFSLAISVPIYHLVTGPIAGI